MLLLMTLVKARLWIRANNKPRNSRTSNAADPLATVATDLPPREESEVPADYSWEARLDRARKMEVEVYQASQRAIGRNDFNVLQSLLASYQKALQGIKEAETTALEARIQTGELIHRDTARAIMMELLIPIRNALDLLPMTERNRCNPQEPAVAENALRGWKDALLLRLSQADTKF